MTKHTPGPWEVARDWPFIYIVPRPGIERTIAEMYMPINRDNVNRMEQIEADTRLMRAAPEMLELLRPFAALLGKHMRLERDSKPVFAVNDDLITIGDLRKARALIAKIDGEEI